MKIYVVGAGVSKTVGYPLGLELFDKIDEFIRSSGRLFNRFRYDKDWPALKRWLSHHKNPVVAEAYRSRQLEHLFTVLDLAQDLRINSLGSVLTSAKKGKAAVIASQDRWRSVDRNSSSYQKYRQIILWALEAYLEHEHHCDVQRASGGAWACLRAFGRKLCPGDVILSFNYDSCLERILLEQGKWSLKDGYGFDLVFQRSESDETPVDFPTSLVKVLHLHGSVGWYRKPSMKEQYRARRGGGAVPRDVRTPAPLETPIALDPLFLRDLGLHVVDACLPRRPPSQRKVFLHPSFLKDFEADGDKLFSALWRRAADALREADEIAILGYSLPSADSAALTLLLTNCDQFKVRIVNRNKSTNERLMQLLARQSNRHWVVPPATSFEEWLRTIPDCE